MAVPNRDAQLKTYYLDCTLPGVEIRDAGEFFAVRWKVDVDDIYFQLGEEWSNPLLISKRCVLCVEPFPRRVEV